MSEKIIRERIADGVYLLSDGTVIKATQVEKAEAEKLLSQAAKHRAEVDGDNLIFPSEDGRNSIPLYELGQKGYIKMKPHQLREHLTRLVQLVPEYLKERGFLPNKKIDTIDMKIEKEYNKYLKDIMTKRKRDIILKAQEINDMRKIKEYICNADFPQSSFGLLINQNNLMKTLYNAVKENKYNLSVTNDAVGKAINSLAKKVTYSDTSKFLQPFSKELKLSRKNKYQGITFTVKLPDKPATQLSMKLDDFYKYLDGEMLDRFAQSAMLDFPSSDYFGKSGEKLFEQVRQNRFCSALKQNFNDFSLDPQNGYLITINSVDKKAPTQDEYTQIKNCHVLREYVTACYENSTAAIENIDSYFKDKKDVIDGIQKIINPFTAAKAVVPAATEAIKNVIEKAVEHSQNSKIITSDIIPEEKGESIPFDKAQQSKSIKAILDEANSKKSSSVEAKNKAIIDNILSQINPVHTPTLNNNSVGLSR